MVEVKLEQMKVDELVDRFYSKLTKNYYFSFMFAERNVDIDILKNRQKIFINRLLNHDRSEEEQDTAEQVQKRHSFHTTPERAKIWLNTMESTMDEMKLDHEVRVTLLTKMNFLMDKLIKNDKIN
ncbi:globin domain-containing protein [Aquibacillus saliphilus]|uniref:globin domain-containing protein n=1 Tax=Aquibacillus saliphilus TaxID=1909422 RepID=UPI001CF0A9B2|nr:hypothetical protein [Aquibacillus saliphilus]